MLFMAIDTISVAVFAVFINSVNSVYAYKYLIGAYNALFTAIFKNKLTMFCLYVLIDLSIAIKPSSITERFVMFNLIKGLVEPTKTTELKTNVILDVKNVSLVNIENDVSNVIETLKDINNLYMFMFENGSFLNVAFACSVTAKMYNDKKHVQTIKGIEYTRKELVEYLKPFLTQFKNKDVGKTMKSLMGKLYERKIPLGIILKDGYIIEGLRSTKNYIDANYELDGSKKVKNNNENSVKPTTENETTENEPTENEETKSINSVDTSKCESVEEAIQIHLDMIKTEYKLNDAELANLIIKQLKVKTTSNKSVVAFKLANAK